MENLRLRIRYKGHIIDMPSFSDQHTQLILLFSSGEERLDFFNGFKQAGKHQINFDASDLSAGIYFVVMQTNKSLKTLKIVLLK